MSDNSGPKSRIWLVPIFRTRLAEKQDKEEEEHKQLQRVMRDANTIMLLLKSLKLAILFRFKLLNTSSNSSKFSSSNYIFVIMRCQKLMKCLFSVGDFFCQFWSNRSKKIVEFFSNVCGFCTP